jgi:hypothetical protein
VGLLTSWTRRLTRAMERAQVIAADPRFPRPVIPAAAIRQALVQESTKRDPVGLRIYGFVIEGPLALDGVEVPVSLDFNDCRFDSDISMYGCQIPTLHLGSCELQGLMANAARVAGNFNTDQSTFKRPVKCFGMRVGGQLSFSNTTFEFSSASADATESAGPEVEPVLSLDRTVVDGILVLNQIRSAGPVTCAAVQAQSIQALEMDIHCEGALALNFQGVVAPQGIAMDGAKVTGQVSLSGSQVGAIHMVSVYVSNEPETAIDLERCQVRENIYLMKCHCSGELAVNGASVAQLRLEGSQLSNPGGGMALTAEHLSATTVLMREVHAEGHCDFASASISHFILDDMPPAPGSYSPVLDLTGADFAEVSGYPMTTRRQAVTWLERRPELTSGVFVSQPWHQMAAILDRHGRPEDARWLRWQAARRSARATGGLSRVSRSLYGVFAGHGYYAGRRSLAWLVILFVSAFVVALVSADQFRPVDAPALGFAARTPKMISGSTSCDQLPEDLVCFSPGLYALEIVVPSTGEAQVAAWTVRSSASLTLVFSFFRLLGWIFTALLLAAVTGLLRKV